MTNTLKRLFRKAYNKARDDSFAFGLVGKHNPVGPVTFSVEGRADYLWVTLADKTVVQARNEAGIPQTEDLPVKLRVTHGTYVIVSRDNSNQLAVPTPTPPSGVLPHEIEEHSDVTITAAASGDVLAHNGTDWIDEAPLTASAGAGSAGKLIRLDAAGHVDATMINDGDIDHTAITNVGTNSHATIDSHIAATAAHGATGAVVGTTNVQTLTNKTLTTPVIADFTSAQHDHLDADDGGTLTSAAIPTFTEEVQDIAGGMVTGNTETGIAVTYDDTAGKLNFDAQTAGDARYAPIANGVTNGNTHDHVGGDGAQIDHGGTGGLADDDHTQYALLAGRATGQTLKGGTGSGDDLTLESTNHATKGFVFLQPTDGFVAIGPVTPVQSLHMLRDGVNPGVIMERTGAYSGTDQVGIFQGRYAGDSLAQMVVRRDGADDAAAIEFQTQSAGGALAVVATFLSNAKIAIGNLTSVGASWLGVRAGTSTNDAAVGGVLFVSTTAVGNVGTGTDDLISYSVPANTLAVNGQSVEFEAWGTIANSAGTKTLLAVYGATTVLTAAFAAVTGDEWVMRGRIVRTGAATQKAHGSVVVTEPSNPTTANVTTAAETLSGAVTLKIQGVGTANNDVVCEGLVVKWDDGNS